MTTALYGTCRDHPAVANCYNSLGDVHREMGDCNRALEYLSKSLAMRIALYGAGKDHPYIANSYHSLDEVYREIGDYKLSLEYYTKSLEMKLSHISSAKNIGHISNCLLQISKLYSKVNQPSNASTCYSQALIVCRDGTLLTCKVLIKLSKFLIGQSDYKFALQFLKCAQRLDVSQKYTCYTQYYMGICYMYIHNWKKSWLCLYLALSTYQSLPHCKPSDLAQVHLSICQLLLHVVVTCWLYITVTRTFATSTRSS